MHAHPHGLSITPFDNGNLFFRQGVQLVHQRINLPVRGLNLPLAEGLIGMDGGLGELLVLV